MFSKVKFNKNLLDIFAIIRKLNSLTILFIEKYILESFYNKN